MEAISQAAAEITAEMPAGSVDVRLNGRELDFVVAPRRRPRPHPPAPPAPPAPEEIEEEGGLARITLRIPESVKARAEEFAARSGHSLNTWLVQVVRAATRENAINVDIDLSSIPFFGGNDPFGGKGRGNKQADDRLGLTPDPRHPHPTPPHTRAGTRPVPWTSTPWRQP